MKKLIIAAIAAVALGAVSCKDPVNETPFVDQNVAVILRSPTDTIGLQIANGIVAAGMQYTIFTEIFSADSLTDYQGQLEIINDIDPLQYIGVIIIPAADNSELRSAIATLSELTPVVLAQENLSGNLPVLTFVGTDNLAAGESLGVNINKALSEGDTINIIQTSADPITEARLFGLNSRTEALGHPTYSVDITGTADAGYITEGILELYPNTKAIVTSDPHSALLVVAKLKSSNRSDIKVFTFDIPNSIATAITKGSIAGTMASDTYHIGYNSIMAIINYSIDNEQSRTQYQAPMYIDQSNIGSKEAEIYLNEI